MKVRDLQRALQDRACAAIRIKGSHEIWKLPNGNCLSIVVNHKNADVSRIVLANVNKGLREAGIEEV